MHPSQVSEEPEDSNLCGDSKRQGGQRADSLRLASAPPKGRGVTERAHPLVSVPARPGRDTPGMGPCGPGTEAVGAAGEGPPELPDPSW